MRISNRLFGRGQILGKVITPVEKSPQEATPKTARKDRPLPSASSRFLQKLDPREYITSYVTFIPSKKEFRPPSQRGIKHEEVFIDTPDDERLHGYFLPAHKETQKIMLFLHGNDGNVNLWYEAAANLQEHLPVNALVVDYRGYGNSTGQPSTHGVITDALSMYDFLIDKKYKPEDILVFGRSLGGGIGLELASRVPVRGVVVQSSFLSFVDVKKLHYPYFPSFLLKGNFLNSKEVIKKINVPVLISHGTEDKRVPLWHAEELFQRANEPKRLVVLKGAGHEHLKHYYTEEYFEALRGMIG